MPWLGTAGVSPWLRRGVLVAALLGVALIPYPVLSDQPSAAVCVRGCHGTTQLNMLRWTADLSGIGPGWTVDPGLTGTAPSAGQAYVAAGSGLVAIGVNLTVAAYTEGHGKPLWQQELPGFPDDAQIVSVRAWPDEVTVGVTSGSTRTEVVLDGATGVITGEYPSALYGGAVGGSEKYTVIVGPSAVTSYTNGTRKVRWRHPAEGRAQQWRTDGSYLYLAGGDLSGTPVTGLNRIDIATGGEEQIVPWDSPTFDGSLAAAYESVVLFTSPDGVTAYDRSKGTRLWSVPGAVPVGDDPVLGRIYLSRGASLLAVRPGSGRYDVVVGGTYVVRDGVGLGLDLLGQDGAAWGYDLTAQRVTLTASGLAYPHYFADLSGLGGSADSAGPTVVIVACAGTAPAPSPSASASGLAGAPSAPLACARPELVALGL